MPKLITELYTVILLNKIIVIIKLINATHVLFVINAFFGTSKKLHGLNTYFDETHALYYDRVLEAFLVKMNDVGKKSNTEEIQQRSRLFTVFSFFLCYSILCFVSICYLQPISNDFQFVLILCCYTSIAG